MAWAQEPNRPSNDDYRWDPAETRQEQRQRMREARQEFRERMEDWRDQRREARRERMEQFRERFRGDGVHLRFLRSYTLAEGETTNEPIVVIGGSAQIDGRAVDDVVVVGGSLHLGPKAVVEGNAVSVGGSVTLDPGASVRGSIDENRFPWANISIGPDLDRRRERLVDRIRLLGIGVQAVSHDGRRADSHPRRAWMDRVDLGTFAWRVDSHRSGS